MHTLQSRVSIPAAASQFVVHGVFVHVFNEDKSTRGLDLLDFVQALLQYLKEAFEASGCAVCSIMQRAVLCGMQHLAACSIAQRAVLCSVQCCTACSVVKCAWQRG